MIPGVTSFDVIRQILVGYVDFLNPDRVYFYNQKYKIPDDEDLFVVVSYRTSKILSVRSKFGLDINQDYTEVMDVNTLEGLSVNLLSKNLQAYNLKELFVAALSSYVSEGIQSKNAIKILRIAPINDLSEVEGSTRLYRYEIPFNMFAWYERLTVADYYNSFNFQVIANVDPDVVTPVISIPTSKPIL